jgi:5S rRNA maturation endonuclease (ribonuclease M5)
VTEPTPPGDVLDLVLGKLDGVRRQGGSWMARCPAHDDHKASLSVARGTEQQVVLRCHANCDSLDILDALGLSWADLSANGRAPAGDWTPAGPAIATYTYTDADGRVLFGVCRTADKQFRQWRPDPAKPHGRAWSVKDVKLVLYRLPKVIAAVDAGEPVFLAEGEKDVHALEAAGVTATCNPMGAGKWRATYSKTLAGADVVIVADNDKPGMDHARKVAEDLSGVAASVRLVWAREGKDAADHLAAGYGPDDFADLAADDLGAEPVPAPRPAVTMARGDGSAILDETEAAWCRYVAWSSEAQPVAATLWTAHSHAIEAADTTPYLDISSPEPESGKTRVLEVAELLAARAWMLVEPSEAAMFRKIARDKPTVLLDEYDALFGNKTDGREALRALLNVGYRRGATVPRCVGDGSNTAVEDFPVFGAKALAGLAGKLPRTIATRSIPIRLQRRAKSQEVERFRFGEAKAALGPLHDRLEAWAELVTPELRGARPAIPAALSDRQADCWEPLLAIADAAGGHWPQRARDAATAIHGADPAADPGTGILLLAHIEAVFRDTSAEELPTAILLRELVARDDGPWAGWWEKDLADSRVKGPSGRLARMLKPYGIAPRQMKVDGDKTRGYHLASFGETFDRYRSSFPSAAGTDPETVPRYAAGQAMFPDEAVITLQASDLGSTEVPSGERYRPQEEKNGSTEIGPCTRCGRPRRRYGDDGSPLCPACQALADGEDQ